MESRGSLKIRFAWSDNSSRAFLGRVSYDGGASPQHIVGLIMLSCLAVSHGLHRLDVHGAYSCGPTGIARKPDLRVSEPEGRIIFSQKQ